MELQNTGETSEQTTYAEVTASQPVLSASGEMSKNPVLNIPSGMTKKSKSDKKQSNDTEKEQHFKASEPPVNKLIVIDRYNQLDINCPLNQHSLAQIVKIPTHTWR